MSRTVHQHGTHTEAHKLVPHLAASLSLSRTTDIFGGSCLAKLIQVETRFIILKKNEKLYVGSTKVFESSRLIGRTETNMAVSTILECIDYSCCNVSRIPLPYMAVVHLRSAMAFGLFHSGQMTVILLYSDFLPLLAVILSVRRAIVELTFLFGLELPQQHEGRKAGRTRVECACHGGTIFCFFFINC